ncbi:MAG: MFS transporter, partial [candidate division Zixibacteria bacterium]|nr:MFS transporter [candidate division Zixibacteria bacterium]
VDIAFYNAIAYLVAPTQYFISIFGRWIPNKKAWIALMGFFEAFFRCLIITIPFLFVETVHLKILTIFLSLGLIAGYLYSPLYNGWLASTVPTAMRARFTSRQTIVSTLAGLIASVAAGGFVDQYAEGQQLPAFITVFIFGTVAGLLGYALVYRAPYPAGADTPNGGQIENLLLPFRDRHFRRLIVFYSTWNFAISFAGPLFSVFMLDRLDFSYTAISIFNAIGMTVTVLGYQFWGGLIDRFGGKPVMQILLIPGALTAILWGFCQPGAYLMVGFAMLISGIVMSGIQVAVTPLLFARLPQDNEQARISYLASWSTTNNLIYAFGPILGGIVVGSLQGGTWNIYGFVIYDIGMLFFLSGLLRLVPFFLIRGVEEAKAISSTTLLNNMFQGNFLTYTFHNVVFSLTSEEDRRARAMLAMGRSRNPMAVEKLIQSLSDASPRVRSQAARALGESGSPEAIPSLMMELIDRESDIRSEAAEALGKLKHPDTIGPLFDALEDADPRVQASAIRALSEIDDDQVGDLLFFYMSNHYHVRTFPAFVDALGMRRDFRIIKPALEHLADYRSTAIRHQMLNSVCRALGAGSQFYHYLSIEQGKRYRELDDRIRVIVRDIPRSAMLPTPAPEAMETALEAFRAAHEHNDSDVLMKQAGVVARLLQDSLPGRDREAREILAIYLTLMAINNFITCKGHDDLDAARDIFLIVCLGRISELMEQET